MTISRRDVLKYGSALGALSTGLPSRLAAQTPASLSVMTYESLPATQAVLKRQADEFSAVHPGVQVAPLFSSGEALRTQVASMLQSGIAPDVVMLDLEDTLLYSRNGLLEPVTELVDAIGGIPDRFRGRIDGVDYFVPVGVKFTYSWYRSDLFAKAGLQPPKTWAELETTAAKFTSGGEYGFLVSSAETFDYPVSELMSFGFGNGVEFIDDEGNIVFDQGQNKKTLAETLAFLKSMAKYSPNGANLQWGAVIDSYVSGRVAMADFIGARIKAIALQNNPPIGQVTKPMLQPYGKAPGNRLSVQGYMIFKGGKNKELSRALVQHLTTQQRNIDFLVSSALHVLPVSRDTFRGPYRATDVVQANPDIVAVLDAAWDGGHSPVYDLNGKKPNWQRVRVFTSTTYNKIIAGVIQGDQKPEEAIDQGAAAARALLRRA
jgi:multiple sugar transport system substrate-binding protein